MMTAPDKKTHLRSALEQCRDLFQTENCALYVGDDEQGTIKQPLTGIPEGFPRSFREMYEFSSQTYSLMLSLGLPQEYLAYPNFDDLIARKSALSFEECAQFLLFYMKLNLKYGQEMYYKLWRDGTVLAVVKRMLSLLDEWN